MVPAGVSGIVARGARLFRGNAEWWGPPVWEAWWLEVPAGLSGRVAGGARRRRRQGGSWCPAVRAAMRNGGAHWRGRNSAIVSAPDIAINRVLLKFCTWYYGQYSPYIFPDERHQTYIQTDQSQQNIVTWANCIFGLEHLNQG